jgi:tetratricopeptide (TPR) repeat protein
MRSSSVGWSVRAATGYALVVLAWVMGDCTSVMAQRGDSIPSEGYFATMGAYYAGDYKDALDSFLSEGRGGIKTATARWIDSICYHTMTGECYYQMGDLNKALEHYTAALKLYVTYSDWMIRVRFEPMRAAAPGAIKRVPWGNSTRRAPHGVCPRTMLIEQGSINSANAVKQSGGGVVQQAQLIRIKVDEIVRCTVLAIRRRAMLLGPVSRYDPLTNEVLSALLRRPGPPNHWSEAWIDLPLGLAMVAAGKEGQATQPLERSLLAGGQSDHPLTSTGLLTLGILAMQRGDYRSAANLFAETTYSAVNYGDAGVLEEAFRYGTLCHMISNQKGLYPLLLPAIDWSRREGLYQLQTTLLLLAAENYVALGKSQEASRAVADAKRAIGRRSMLFGRTGARLNYAMASVSYQDRRLGDGDAALGSAMSFMQNGSLWLFHISAVDRLYVEGAFTTRQAVDLYQAVLRDPQPADWAVDPMEALAVLTTPHVPIYERWFEATVERNEPDVALEVGDRLRRHRFFSTLPMGGRIHSLRWLLNAPEKALNSQAQLNRQELLTRYSSFGTLATQSQQIRTRLHDQPAAIKTSESTRAQIQSLSQLAAVSLQQEGLLREIALHHEPAEMAFPPLYSTKQIMKSLPEGHAMLAFVCTSRNMYGFLYNSQRSEMWRVSSPAALYKKIGEMLRDFGLYEQSHEVTVKDLAGEQWRASAREVLQILTKGTANVDFSRAFDELIIVPDGMLWYLPFEVLQVEVDKQPRSLISRFRIRYVPTAGMAVPDGRGRKPVGTTGVAVGPIIGRESEMFARTSLEQLTKVLPGTMAVPVPLPAPSSVYSSLFDRLVVLEGIAASEHGPYAWAPLPTDRGKPGSTLDDWMALPWEGPQEMVLAGYHTACENAMKRVNPAAAGNEVFLSVCGLMATGARTLLLSRWLSGGQTSCDLAREYVQELPHTFPADAWQRSVLLCTDTAINFESEPRVKHAPSDEPPKAGHPFFWAGYMLIDSAGTGKSEIPPPEPALRTNSSEPSPTAQPAATEKPATGEKEKKGTPPPRKVRGKRQ